VSRPVLSIVERVEPLGAKGKKEVRMKRLLLVFWMAFLAGCDNYSDSQIRNEPQMVELQRQSDELREMSDYIQRDSQQIIADANTLYKKDIPAFLDTLNDEQRTAYNEYWNILTGNIAPQGLEYEDAINIIHKCLTREQRLYIAELVRRGVEITKRKNDSIAQIAEYQRKQKEMLDYGQSIIQANHRDYERTLYQNQISQNNTQMSQGQQIQVIPIGGQQVIESQIDGDFKGWDGETIFKLTNGQIWQQSSYAYMYHYAYGPEVTIYKVNGRFKMKVEGVEDTIEVVRIK
jgi:hypothetical protein